MNESTLLQNIVQFSSDRLHTPIRRCECSFSLAWKDFISWI